MIDKKDIEFYNGINNYDKQIVLDAITLDDSVIQKLNMNDIEILNLSETRREIGFNHNTLKCKKYFVIRRLIKPSSTFKVALGNHDGYDYHFELKTDSIESATQLCKAIIFTISKNLLLEIQNNIF